MLFGRYSHVIHVLIVIEYDFVFVWFCRACLYKFFYPADHQTMEMTQLPDHNQKRKHEKFDFRMNVIGDIMFDILFTKDKVCISDNYTLKYY